MYIFWLVRFRLALPHEFFFSKIFLRNEKSCDSLRSGEKISTRNFRERGEQVCRSVEVSDAFTERAREIDDLSFPLSSRRWESRRSRRRI